MKRDIIDSPCYANKSASRINDSLSKAFRDFREDFKEIADVFSSFNRERIESIGVEPYLLSRGKGRTTVPRMNVVDMGDHYEVVMVVAGFDRDEIEIQLKENVLDIQLRKDKEKTEEVEDKKYLVREIASRSFSRGFCFPEPVTEEGTECEYKDGVITCIVKKTKTKEESHKIEIK